MSNNTLWIFFQKNRGKLYVFIIVFLFSVGGCKAESVELRAMSDASVVTAHLVTGTEISRRAQDRETKPLLGKPKQPELRIEYEPTNNHTKEDVFVEIVEIFKKDGWVSNTERSGYFTASLLQEYFTIMAKVLVHSKYNIVSVTFVTIPR
jgi:hypothetical protein